MWQLLKRDFYIRWHIIGMTYFLLLIVYLLQLPNIPSGTYLFLFMYFIAISFYSDQLTHINRILISTPIKRNYIVLARYLFIFLNYTVFYIVDFTLFHQESMTLFLLKYTALCLMISISLPIYYLFHSIWIRVVVHFAVLALSTFVFILLLINPKNMFDFLIFVTLEFIDFQQVLALFTFSGIFLYVSYILSCFIFSKKDII